MWIIDLLIWGLFRLLSPPGEKHEDTVRDFIYMDSKGNIINSWLNENSIDDHAPHSDESHSEYEN